jgi:hypothetical protein
MKKTRSLLLFKLNSFATARCSAQIELAGQKEIDSDFDCSVKVKMKSRLETTLIFTEKVWVRGP